MRQIALKFGIIGGIIIALPMFIIIPNIDSIGFGSGVAILFVSMIVSFISVFMGISSVRKNLGGGYIGFRNALITGVVITVMTSVFYAAASMLLYNIISPDFQEKLNAFMITQMKAAHKSTAEINKFTADAAAQLADKNIFINTAYALLTPLKFGLFFTFTSSLILRKKEFPATLN